MRHTISNNDDVIDSRDVIARISELESDLQTAHEAAIEEATADADAVANDGNEPAEMPTTDFEEWLKVQADNYNDDATELATLRALAADASDYSPDWTYGATLIRDSYFETYAQELAEDIGAINHDAQWPNTCIDWEQAARELQQDYTAIEWDGVTYWVR